VQQPPYFLRCTPPSSTFIEPILFNSSFFQMFRHLLGLESFDNLKGSLTCKQTSFLITFGGIKFILIATIAPVAYLGSWALVALIIDVRLMVDQHPFLLEALAKSTISPSFSINNSRWHVISYHLQFTHVFIRLNN
jgi:hypothetical protein